MKQNLLTMAKKMKKGKEHSCSISIKSESGTGLSISYVVIKEDRVEFFNEVLRES